MAVSVHLCTSGLLVLLKHMLLDASNQPDKPWTFAHTHTHLLGGRTFYQESLEITFTLFTRGRPQKSLLTGLWRDHGFGQIGGAHGRAWQSDQIDQMG